MFGTVLCVDVVSIFRECGGLKIFISCVQNELREFSPAKNHNFIFSEKGSITLGPEVQGHLSRGCGWSTLHGLGNVALVALKTRNFSLIVPIWNIIMNLNRDMNPVSQ